MITKHFFKILGTFIIMIILGIAALFATSYFSTEKSLLPPTDKQLNGKTQVAK